jgi:transposase-like protein
MKIRQAVSSNGNRQAMSQEPDPQVTPKAKRRRFSAEYKLRILDEADNCTERGEIGALLRREGLYSSHLTDWRKQRERGELDGRRNRKRGRKPDPQAAEMARLQRENEQLRSRLDRAERIIDVQKKLAHLLGSTPMETLNGEM